MVQVQNRLKPKVKIVPWNALAQTEIVEELFLVYFLSLHTIEIKENS